MIQIKELTLTSEIELAFPLMAQLRTALDAASFVARIRRQQANGYRLFGGFDEGKLCVLAGVRDAENLVHGPHLFVDDLVTDQNLRHHGRGTEMLRWLADHAEQRGFTRIHLHSRDTALGFYRKLGFDPATAVPCGVDTSSLKHSCDPMA